MERTNVHKLFDLIEKAEASGACDSTIRILLDIKRRNPLPSEFIDALINERCKDDILGWIAWSYYAGVIPPKFYMDFNHKTGSLNPYRMSGADYWEAVGKAYDEMINEFKEWSNQDD